MSTETQYAVIGDWLTQEVGRCTCAGGGEWPHESHCGYEPLVKISEIEPALVAAGFTLTPQIRSPTKIWYLCYLCAHGSG